MTVETVEVPKKWYEGLGDFFKKENGPDTETKEPEEKPDEFTAVEKERDEFKSQLDTMKAKQEQAELFTAVKAEFESDEFGAAFQGVGEEDEAIKMLASLPEAERAWVLTQFKALSAQIDESKLTGEIGEDADPISDDPVIAYNAAIKAHQEEHKTSYQEAINAVNVEKPELGRAYDNATRRK